MLMTELMNISMKNIANVNAQVGLMPHTKKTATKNPMMLVSIKPALRWAYFIYFTSNKTLMDLYDIVYLYICRFGANIKKFIKYIKDNHCIYKDFGVIHMNKKILTMMVLLSVVLFVAACTQSSTTTTAPGKAVDTTPANTVDTTGGAPPVKDNTSVGGQVKPDVKNTNTQPTKTIADFYKYSALRNYEYELTSAAGKSVLDYAISSDTLDGTPTWLQQINIQMESGGVQSKTWLDKTTLQCLKVRTSVSVSGKNIDMPGQCPTTGASSVGTSSAAATKVGTETITTRMGTYTADKYTSGNSTFWISAPIPLPIKIVDGGSDMELVSYS